jgi:hypothetical protein
LEERYSSEKIEKLTESMMRLVDGIISNLISEHFDEAEFYQRLWKATFCNDELFATADKKIFVLYVLAQDGRIPYYKLEPGLKMSDESFKEVVQQNEELLNKVNFALNCQYGQRTELGSILLRLMNSVEDEQARAVVLANILFMNEKKTLVNLLQRSKLPE